MSNVTQQIRESLAGGKRMSTKELTELNCWGPEDRQRASVAVCNMRSRGELLTDSSGDVHVHQLSGKKVNESAKTANPEAEASAASTAAQEIAMGSQSQTGLDAGDELVAAIVKRPGGVAIIPMTVAADDDAASAPIDTKDPGLFEIQRVTLAEFVPAQPGVKLFLHRAGDVTIETARSFHGQERVLIPQKHVRDIARKLLEFIGET